MKKIQITQNTLGHFYFGENTRQHAFKMVIKEDNEIMSFNGKKAIVSYTIAENDCDTAILEASDFENISQHIEEILEICATRSLGVISTHDYIGELASFISVYKENYAELRQSLLTERMFYLNKEVDKINKELSGLSTDYVLREPADVIPYIEAFNNKISSNKRNVNAYLKDLESIIEGSEKAIDINKRIERINSETALINNLLNMGVEDEK